MTPDTCRALARYNRWMNEKIYVAASEISEEERTRDVGAFFRSLHGTLNHLLLADRVWLGRFTGVSLPGDWLGPGGIRSLDQVLYADFAELRRERAKTDDELDAWIATLTQAKLDGPLRYERKGKVQEEPLRWAVMHLFNHQTHHRGQATTLLMQAGRDPGVTDLIAMLRAEASS